MPVKQWSVLAGCVILVSILGCGNNQSDRSSEYSSAKLSQNVDYEKAPYMLSRFAKFSNEQLEALLMCQRKGNLRFIVIGSLGDKIIVVPESDVQKNGLDPNSLDTFQLINLDGTFSRSVNPKKSAEMIKYFDELIRQNEAIGVKR